MFKNAIAGVLIGIVLFLASFAVLYWNEGRVDLSDIAKKATIIQADNVQANTSFEGQLVSASGTVTSEPMIGDDLYLEPGAYLTVERNVDVYSWVEKSETVTRSSSDGETTETEYTYVMEWASSPADSSDFHEPEGHTNLEASVSDHTTTAGSARLEQYSFVSTVIELPVPAPLLLSSDVVTLTQNATLANDTYIYVRNSTTGTYVEPQLGDVRVSYAVVKVPFEGTVFGKLEGTSIKPFVSKKGDTLYRVFAESHEESLVTLHQEYTMALWAFRFLGFLMMWIGLGLLFGPISAIIDFVPVLGEIGRMFIGLATFAVSLVLAGVTILVSAILHNIFAVIIVAVLLLGGAVAAGKIAKQKQLASHPEKAVGG